MKMKSILMITLTITVILTSLTFQQGVKSATEVSPLSEDRLPFGH